MVFSFFSFDINEMYLFKFEVYSVNSAISLNGGGLPIQGRNLPLEG